MSDSLRPVNRSTPGLLSVTNSRSLLIFMFIESVMSSSHFILCRPLLLLPPIPPSIREFPMSQPFTWGGQVLASVLPMNIQDWAPLGWTGWISLRSKGLSRVFSYATFQKHQFFSAQLSSLLLLVHFKFSYFHILMFLYLSGNWMGIKLMYCYIVNSLLL